MTAEVLVGPVHTKEELAHAMTESVFELLDHVATQMREEHLIGVANGGNFRIVFTVDIEDQ